MDNKIATKYLNALNRYFNKHSSQTHPTFATEFAPLIEAIEYVKGSIGDKENLIFLDVGCGTGNVLFTAKEILGDKVKYIGIEADPYIANIAQNVNFNFNILVDDMISPESIDVLAKADIVYSYRPIPNYERQKFMYDRIHDNLKQGAYFICNDGNAPEFDKCRLLTTILGVDCCSQTVLNIYKKD